MRLAGAADGRDGGFDAFEDSFQQIELFQQQERAGIEAVSVMKWRAASVSRSGLSCFSINFKSHVSKPCNNSQAIFQQQRYICSELMADSFPSWRCVSCSESEAVCEATQTRVSAA